ncbi:B-lymphocyte antigen CD19 [Elgaria multicarinata webbii]|uniref:B-lymphocyte antigen CD19 n=1 Tax=Elgaria multicarinata webbii TaxID=159646 RepID=UPI002FCD309D
MQLNVETDCFISSPRPKGKGNEIKYLTSFFQIPESHAVFLPCTFDAALVSDYLDLIWLSPSGEELLSMYVMYGNSEVRLEAMWRLIYKHFSPVDTWFSCSWNGIPGRNQKFKNRIGNDDPEDIEDYMESSSGNNNSSSSSPWYQENDSYLAWSQEYLDCDAPIPSNWTRGSLLWTQDEPQPQKTVLMNVTIRRTFPYWQYMRPNVTYLILPSVTFKDAGNYTCRWKNQTQLVQLKVTSKPAFWLQFQHRHWIIWTVSLGYVITCLSFLFCFLRLQRTIRTRRQQMKLKGPAKRRYFHAKRNKAPVSNGIRLLPANDDGMEQVDVLSYENVLPDMRPRSGGQLLQKEKILPNTTDMEDEEEYECPDSETELKSDDDDNYENTQEEVKQGDVVLNEASPYENSKAKTKSGSHNWDSADSLYANNSQKALKNQAQDPLDEDGENYENVEEEPCLSPGAARLIAGLRLQLSLDPPVDKQDGGSEASTGSQSYEEMNGALCPTASKSLHLQPNTSNEEDADSYENMESPNSFSSRKECSLDPHGNGPAFGSTRQHLSSPFGADLRGGLLCSD